MSGAFFHGTIRFFYIFLKKMQSQEILKNRRRQGFTIPGLGFSIYKMVRLDMVIIDSAV